MIIVTEVISWAEAITMVVITLKVLTFVGSTKIMQRLVGIVPIVK